MLFSEDTFFSIGQFAKLHEINKKTLMWYDEIGLLKPAATGKNGYRYYTYRQSPVLETILMLRELGVSIRNIFLYIQMPDPLQKSGLHIPPRDKYLRAFCRGSWDKLPARYQEILSYAEKNRLRLYGYAYEKGINEIVIDTLDDYITQIEIPVKTEA